MVNNSDFIRLGDEIEVLRKDAESYDTAANICNVAFDLGTIHHRIHDSYCANQLTKEEQDDLYNRIRTVMQYIQNKEIRE